MADRKPFILQVLKAFLFVGAIAVLACLVADFGFDIGELRGPIHLIEVVVTGLFVSDTLARWLFVVNRGAFIRRYWMEFALIGLLAAGVGAGGAGSYILAVQGYLAVRILLMIVHGEQSLAATRTRPALILVGSFLVVIAMGTVLLMTPRCRPASARPWSVTDALFTATSAACVTGLAVRDVGADLSFRGQAVLLSLIQVGGLGLATFIMLVGALQSRRLRMKEGLLLKDLMSATGEGDSDRFLFHVFAITLGAEALGAAILFGAAPEGPVGRQVWWAVFHSVSAFCNAGFGLAPDSLMGFSGSARVCGTIMVLIVLGGLGFPVIVEIFRFRLGTLPLFRRWSWTLGDGEVRPATRLSAHAKIVLSMTAFLIVSGAALFYFSERESILSGRAPGEQALASFFQSITTRTAGFNSVDIGKLQLLTLLLMIVLMAVGASPISTGGGVKTSAVAVLAQTVRSMLRNRESVEAFHRTIPRGVVNASVAVAALYAAAVLLSTALLAATQRDPRFVDLLFESVSALSTVGLSTGITPKMDDVGRLILSADMLVGRVGPAAIVWTVVSQSRALRYEYPEEPVVVS